MSTLMQAAPGGNSVKALDVERVRADFPILEREVYGRPLVYLDSAASAQKPRAVISAMTGIMETCYANVHRGVHRLSQESTDIFEGARTKAAGLLNAASSDEIVFTRGATEAINLVAHSFGDAFLEAGDEVIISALEHHSNIVPWQLLRDRKGIVLKVIPLLDDGTLDREAFSALLGPRTKLVALTHISNALGSVVPVKEMIAEAKARGDITVLVDGCQAVPHMAVDVQDLGADLYTFSAHKLYGPSGIGVLYGRKELLNALPPYQGGGEMISSVTFEKSTWKPAPHRFEAGTPAIVEAAGLGAAIDYVQSLDYAAIQAHEQGLLSYATARLSEIESLRIYGTGPDKAAIVSFTLDQAHPHDIGTILDRAGVAVRAGHHCAQPVMDRFDVAATVRASFGLYNSEAEVDALVAAVHKVKELFG
ncbi:aminotransferase class V-fold PLP-dependent enzyme [Aquibaculum arenosum]|uniref:Cysteine desulfurase n=1 Tax=Aquibaculum arenosum TaxID=3032591 RepID=A0ABT5YRG8_9PROT|nr:cysteine desulfurase [Fodinicurvata sp. CAU 1616]MDF2097413.1 cysteine desulfurase [Fodinicurvata sp. CAU 1616]